MPEQSSFISNNVDITLDLTFHQLTLFRAVAQYLSYTRAADQLYLSQPAVSQQIKALEQRIGMPLFARQGRGLILTPAGQELLRHSGRILGLFAGIGPLVHDIQQVQRGRVLIGASTSAGTYIVPMLLGAFHTLHPGLHIHLTVANRRVIEEYLLTHQVDLVVMSVIEHHERFVVEHLAPYELVMVASSTHPLATRAGLSLHDLRAETFLLHEPGTATRHDVELRFAQDGLSPARSLEFASIEAIKESVIANIGIAVLSRESISWEVEHHELSILDVQGFPLQRDWHIVHLKGQRLSLAASALRHFLLYEQTQIERS